MTTEESFNYAAMKCLESKLAADDFTKWLSKKYYQNDNNIYHKIINDLRVGRFFKIRTLLEIYKKENNL